jgi:hypothetical protein
MTAPEWYLGAFEPGMARALMRRVQEAMGDEYRLCAVSQPGGPAAVWLWRADHQPVCLHCPDARRPCEHASL